MCRFNKSFENVPELNFVRVNPRREIEVPADVKRKTKFGSTCY
jgi:hypothetical protein